MPKNKVNEWLTKYSPNCGVTGFLMIVGCFADIYFTNQFEWEAWEFGAVFTGIMVPGEGVKIWKNKMNGKKK